MRAEQDRQVDELVRQERPRLRAWIKRRLSNPSDVDDVLQDVLYEFLRMARGLSPIEDIGAWLHRVAANRIVDLFRRKRTEQLVRDESIDDHEHRVLEDLLPSPDAGPEAAYAREILLEEIAESLEGLPSEQYEVFWAHEIDGLSFRELSALSGTSVNTLISRKHYAVLQLRRQLKAIFDDYQDE